MKIPRHTARRTLVRSALAGLALVIALPTIAIAAHPFTDVPGGQWFSGAVDWAYDNNITTGVSPTEFGGEQGFTRYQAVTMLERMDSNIIQPGLDAIEDDLSTMLHALVNGDGAIEPGSTSSGVTATRIGAGIYELDFPVQVSSCAWQATLVIAHDGTDLQAQLNPTAGSIGLAPDTDVTIDLSGIYVETWDQNGANVDRDFSVSVICSPLGGYSGPFVYVAVS